MATYYSSLSDQRDFLTAPYQQHAKTPPENEPEPPHHLHGNMMYLNQHSQFLARSSSSVHEGVETQEGMGFSENSQMGLRSSVHAMGSCEQNLMNQGLSLSLGTQIPSTVDDHSSFQYQYAAQDSYSNSHVYEPTGFVNDILSSRYLKAAQELLDEVVSVKNALKKPDAAEKNKKSSEVSRNMDGTSSDLQESTTVSSSEISQLERKDLQNKLGNLLSMLDEVDKKYRQYYHQMQIVVSSFEMVAGRDAAKAYTSLALQTISRHFRSLRDAITTQIQATKKTLGEEDTTPTGQERLPRLRYVDHQLRQQRSLQQFGVMRHSWRPQRGLPENFVSILRAWLFEHFLHPYPKDSEKIMLARQTGLSRGQVANWFINARVRLWKPMIEEMYNEEFAELNSKSSPEEALKEERDKPWQSEHTKEEIQDPEAEGGGNFAKYDDSKSNYVPEVGMQGCTARLGFANSGCRDNQSTYDPNDIPGNHAGEFSVGEQVSLALGLQECENSQMTMPSGVQFRGKATSHSVLGNNAPDYYFMDLLSLNQHHRMADPQMSPDFVA